MDFVHPNDLKHGDSLLIVLRGLGTVAQSGIRDEHSVVDPHDHFRSSQQNFFGQREEYGQALGRWWLEKKKFRLLESLD